MNLTAQVPFTGALQGPWNTAFIQDRPCQELSSMATLWSVCLQNMTVLLLDSETSSCHLEQAISGRKENLKYPI